MGRKLKILFFGDSSVINTGFAKELRETLKRLSATNKYEIFELGAGYKQWTEKRSMMIPKPGYPDWIKWDIYPMHGRLYGQDCVAQFAEAANVDLVIANLDPWMGAWITCPETYRDPQGKGLEKETIKLIKNRKWKIAWWYPIDGLATDGKFPKLQAEWLKGADHLICFSEWGKEHTIINTGRQDVMSFPFGVDTKVFKPLDKIACRKEIGFSNELPDYKNDFIVFFGCANRVRKDIPSALEAFSIFARDKKDAFLYFHTNLNGEGFDIPDLVSRYDITNKVIFTEGITMEKGITEGQLCKIMNCADVCMSATRGEGRGMIPLENRACGKLCFTTDFSATTELMCHPIEKVRCVFYYPDGYNCILRPYTDVNDMAEKLQWAYDNRDMVEQLAPIAREKAMESDWDNTAKHWIDFLDSLSTN